jgi:myo-inositol-1(or 4)-monophosphatase
VSVAVEDEEGGVAGVVLDPLRGECFAAARGEGATLNGAPLPAPRDLTELGEALVATGFGYEAAVRRAQARIADRLLPAVRDIRRAGSAALDLAWTAAGRFDGFWERNLRPWDLAAGLVILREAGGFVSDAEGKEAVLAHGSVVAGNEAIQRKLLKLLKSASA